MPSGAAPRLFVLSSRNGLRALLCRPDAQPAAPTLGGCYPPQLDRWEPLVAASVRAGFDLREHWPENMEIFNRWPRVTQPRHPSGRAFAGRNPDQVRTTG